MGIWEIFQKVPTSAGVLQQCFSIVYVKQYIMAHIISIKLKLMVQFLFENSEGFFLDIWHVLVSGHQFPGLVGEHFQHFWLEIPTFLSMWTLFHITSQKVVFPSCFLLASHLGLVGEIYAVRTRPRFRLEFPALMLMSRFFNLRSIWAFSAPVRSRFPYILLMQKNSSKYSKMTVFQTKWVFRRMGKLPVIPTWKSLHIEFMLEKSVLSGSLHMSDLIIPI